MATVFPSCIRSAPNTVRVSSCHSTTWSGAQFSPGASTPKVVLPAGFNDGNGGFQLNTVQRYDLLRPEFRHSCLNRLQLRNTLEMVDLAGPAESMLDAGMLANPAARR